MKLASALTYALLAGSISTTAAAQQPAASQAQAGTGAATLVRFEIKDNAIPASLTGKPGNPEQGKAAVIGRQLGNCLACHQITSLSKEPFHGNTGPALDGIADRMSEGEIRLRIVDATKANPDTMMPPFYRSEGLNRVLPRFQGKTILTAEQVEDVVAFLMTLK
jgi:L-cysteine S-thiosulfotransferase